MPKVLFTADNGTGIRRLLFEAKDLDEGERKLSDFLLNNAKYIGIDYWTNGELLEEVEPGVHTSVSLGVRSFAEQP